jgi:hypothetical protein
VLVPDVHCTFYIFAVFWSFWSKKKTKKRPKKDQKNGKKSVPAAGYPVPDIRHRKNIRPDPDILKNPNIRPDIYGYRISGPPLPDTAFARLLQLIHAYYSLYTPATGCTRLLQLLHASHSF